MDVFDAIAGRRSVRKYTAQSIESQTIRSLIDAAVHAPNAINQQPWMFTIIRDQTLLDRISHDAKVHMLAGLPANPQSEQFRSHLSDPDFHIFYHAPTLIVISANAHGPWMVEDCALAAENLMLAAYARGCGTCWIGFAQGYLNTPQGKKLIDLPATAAPVAPIIVGYPYAPPPPVPRKEPEMRWIG